MKKSEKSLTSVQWFKGLGTVFLIQVRCLMSQGCSGISIVAWNDLQVYFQFWVFKPKFQVLSSGSCAAFWFLSIRSWSSLCMEWIRLSFLSKESKNWCMDIWFLWQNIFKSFHAHLLSIISNHLQFFPNWSCTNFWTYYMYKKIW